VSTSLLVLTGAVSCYPALMVNLIWFANEKNVHHVSTEQHGGLKAGVSQAKNSTISQSLCAGELSYCSGSCNQKQTPQMHESDCFAAAMVKLQQLAISKPDEVHRQSRVAIQPLSAPFETSKLVLTTHSDVKIASRLAKNLQSTAIFC